MGRSSQIKKVIKALSTISVKNYKVPISSESLLVLQDYADVINNSLTEKAFELN